MPLPSLLRRPRELLSKLIVRLHEERKEERKGGIVIGEVFVCSNTVCVDGCLVKCQDRMKPLARISLKKCLLNYIKTIDNDCIR